MSDKIISSDRTPCTYGDKCYRTNPEHFKKYTHNTKENEIGESSKKRKSSSFKTQNLSPKKKPRIDRPDFFDVLEKAQPFNLFLSKISSGIPSYNNFYTADIKDILSPQMGVLIKSAQFNYCFDIPWLIDQYSLTDRLKPLLLVHGFQRDEKIDLQREASEYDNIRLCHANMPIPYGTHHSKMMFLCYEEGLRVVITTANLVPHDWAFKTQGIWISDLFKRVPDSLYDASKISFDSKTNFKKDLIEYLTEYNRKELKEWINIIHQHDFTSCKAFLISSIPGRRTGKSSSAFGHLKLYKTLNEHHMANNESKKCTIVGQFSSVGSLGPNSNAWLTDEFLKSLSASKDDKKIASSHKLNLIYPTKKTVRESYEGYQGGVSLPYSIHTAKKQPYLNQYWHHWKSKSHGRDRACPHVKTYLKFTSDDHKVAWMLLTSANLSKAAWGSYEKNKSQFMIRSYEIGVLFIPQYFDEKLKYFDVLDRKMIEKNEKDDKNKSILVPFDIPLTKYEEKDRPWVVDIPYKEADIFNLQWCPPLKDK